MTIHVVFIEINKTFHDGQEKARRQGRAVARERGQFVRKTSSASCVAKPQA